MRGGAPQRPWRRSSNTPTPPTHSAVPFPPRYLFSAKLPKSIIRSLYLNFIPRGRAHPRQVRSHAGGRDDALLTLVPTVNQQAVLGKLVDGGVYRRTMLVHACIVGRLAGGC